LRVGCDSTTKGPAQQKYFISVDPWFGLDVLEDSIGVEHDTGLVRVTFRRRIASVCHSNDIDLELFVHKLKPVKTHANIASILVEKNYSFALICLMRLVHEPPLESNIIFGLEPYFLILHASDRRAPIPGGITLDVLNWLVRHVKHLLLDSINRNQHGKEEQKVEQK